jgi:DNA-binding protein H-NS
MVVMAIVKIVPVDEGTNTTASVDGKVWRKKYQSMPDATSEAVELRIMEPREKTFVDASQRQPTWSGRGYAPTRPFEVDVEELIKRGFLLDA